MRHGSLFSGIGGFDLAAEWMGWTNVFHCEINPFGQKILKHYWPEAELIEDITKFDFRKYHGTVDIVSGGFPCQPFSAAGKRKGTEDDRHLWPRMLEVIKQVRPNWVVGENVAGIGSMELENSLSAVESNPDIPEGGEGNYTSVLDGVCNDLEGIGYHVQPFIIPACAVNAPHRRDRVWFIAHSVNGGHRNNGRQNREADGVSQLNREAICSGMPDRANNETSPDPGSEQLQDRTQNRNIQNTKEKRTRVDDRSERQGDTGDASDSCIQGHKGSKWRGSHGERHGAQTSGSTAKCFEIPTWDNWPTQSPVCSGNDELPGRLDGITFPKWRNESIKAYGNAVVPVLVYEIFKAIQEYEHNKM